MSVHPSENHNSRRHRIVFVGGFILLMMIFLSDPPAKALVQTCDTKCRERDTIYWIPNKDCFTFDDPTCEFCVGATGACDDREVPVGTCEPFGKTNWYRTKDCGPVCETNKAGLVTVEGHLFDEPNKSLIGLESRKACLITISFPPP